MAESDLPKRLRDYARDDHERGCQGRYYDCSCGYDDMRDPLLEEAAARIEQLEAALREIVDYCDNTGKWEPITMTRIIERVDDCARAALEGKP